MRGLLRRPSMSAMIPHKVLVVWFAFNQELFAVRDDLKASGITCHTITGTTKLADREHRRRRFQAGKVRVILLQEKIGQMGMDLSAADTAVYYSNVYDYEVRAQSEDRIVHPAKTDPLLVIDLVTRGTVDEDVVDTLQDKSINSKTFVSRLAARLRERFDEEAA